MHGVVFHELRRYVGARWGAGSWERLRAEAGVERPTYLAFKTYPDAEGHALLGVAARWRGEPLPRLLEDLGAWMGAELLHGYRAVVRPGWTLFDLLARAERLQRAAHVGEGAVSVAVTALRVAPAEVHLLSISRCGLCALWVGLLHGVAEAMCTAATVSERACVFRGAERCVFVVRGRSG